MHAVVITAPGDPDVLRWSEVSDPQPGPGEILIEIAASAVNRADILQRQGFYPPPPGAPPYPGLECAGRVAALGAGVTEWEIGDAVCALLAGGGYAEKVAVSQVQALPFPEGMSIEEAAALPEAACTVYSNLVMIANLRQDETLLVHGGAGGIGTTAIQIAKALGAQVACTAGSDEKLERCRELGADILINYRTDDFVERVRARTDGRGADVVLDVMGASYLARNIDVLAPDGRLVSIGMQGGRKGEIDLAKLMAKRGTLVATSLRPLSAARKGEIVAGVRRHVWPLVAAGKLRPIIDRVFPMREAADAHRLLERSDHIGKIVLGV